MENQKCIVKSCQQELQKVDEFKSMYRGIPRIISRYFCRKCNTFISVPSEVITRKDLKEYKLKSSNPKANARKA